jgi:tryptophanyl-tRNA synthetase
MSLLLSTYVGRGTAGLKPGRTFHLGNYFGTLRKVIRAQDRHPTQNFLFVADLHGLIDAVGKGAPRANVYRLVKSCIYLGVDPERTCIYLQSEIPELMQFMWRLACISPRLNIQVAGGRSSDHFYATLMAADILGLRASEVNVGADLEERIGYCGRLAASMNNRLEASVLPSPKRTAGLADEDNVPGLNGQRMSFSAANYIPLFEDTPGEADDAIESLVTAGSLGSDDPRAGDAVVTRLIKLLSSEDAALAQIQIEPLAVSDKVALLKRSVQAVFKEARDSLQGLRVNDREVEDILEDGRVRVRGEYRETMRELGL